MNIRIALGIISFLAVILIAVLMVINEWIKKRKRFRKRINSQTGI